MYMAKALKLLFPSCYDVCVEKVKSWKEKGLFFGHCLCFHKDTDVADLERGEVCVPHLEEDEDYPDRVNNPQEYESLLDSNKSNSSLFTYGLHY